MLLLIAGLLLGTASPDPDAHHVTLDHRGHAVAASYAPRVVIRHRQVGAVAGAGRAQTLRCAYTASVLVDRHARRADGLVAVRTLQAAPFAGTRPGWCTTQRAAIAAEVAARGEAVRDRLLAAAAEDRAALLADLDAAHGSRGA